MQDDKSAVVTTRPAQHGITVERMPLLCYVGAMTTTKTLLAFVGLRLLQHVLERYLARLNRSYCLGPTRQKRAQATLA